MGSLFWSVYKAHLTGRLPASEIERLQDLRPTQADRRLPFQHQSCLLCPVAKKTASRAAKELPLLLWGEEAPCLLPPLPQPPEPARGQGGALGSRWRCLRLRSGSKGELVGEGAGGRGSSSFNVTRVPKGDRGKEPEDKSGSRVRFPGTEGNSSGLSTGCPRAWLPPQGPQLQPQSAVSWLGTDFIGRSRRSVRVELSACFTPLPKMALLCFQVPSRVSHLFACPSLAPNLDIPSPLPPPPPPWHPPEARPCHISPGSLPPSAPCLCLSSSPGELRHQGL